MVHLGDDEDGGSSGRDHYMDHFVYVEDDLWGGCRPADVRTACMVVVVTRDIVAATIFIGDVSAEVVVLVMRRR